MALIFDAENHSYSMDGVAFPSVTQITRFANYDSANGAQTHLRDRAAVRGRLVHEYCQELDYDGAVEIQAHHSECDGYVAGYKAFLRDYRICRWLAIEHPAANLELGFAGTIDRLGVVDNALTIIDLKTSASINKLGCAAQLNGYHLLANSIGYYVESLKIVQLLKSGDYRVYDFPIDSRAFMACKTLHDNCEAYKRRRKSQ